MKKESVQISTNQTIGICPVSGCKKKEMIKHFHEEEDEFKKRADLPFSKYATQNYPDVCMGNCGKCDNWKGLTERELYIRNNDTFINHVLYEATTFFGYFFFTLPFTIIVGYIAFDEIIAAGVALSLGIAMVFKYIETVFDCAPLSFKSWLGKRFDAKNADVEENSKDGYNAK